MIFINIKEYENLDDAININTEKYKDIMYLYSQALKIMEQKIDIIKYDYEYQKEYDSIDHVMSRIKSPESIMNKMRKDGIETTYRNMILHINDIAGIRIICPLKSNINTIRQYIYEFNDTLTIYKGTNAGIKEGNAVITDKGLIGVVSKVNKESSVVELITNKSSNISVRIGSSYGILNMQDNSLIVSDLSMYDDVFIGEEVYTSGIGNLPGDIYIGNVIDIKANNTEIEKILEVSPVVDLSTINYVMVVV